MFKNSVFVIGMIIVLLIGVGGTIYFNSTNAAAEEIAELETQTATVRRSDLIISASGAGTVVPAEEISLSFSSSGVLGEIYVQVGDQVYEGDQLAKLDSIEQLIASVTSDQIDVLTAQQAVDDLHTYWGKDLAEAYLVVIEAQEALQDAEDDRAGLNYGRCDDDTRDLYYSRYRDDVEKVEDFEAKYVHDNTNTRLLEQLVAARESRDTNLANYNYCIGGYDENTISEAEANIAIAQANLDSAQAYYESLINGPNVSELALAEAKLANAEAKLAVSQKNLDNALLVAPIDGVVTEINGVPGETVGSGTFMTIADLARPLIEVYLDETDMDKIAVGYEAEIVFDAFPDEVFTGTVIQVSPELQKVNNVNAVQGLIAFSPESYNKTLNLMTGMNADVEVIGGKAENALVVPVEALYEIAPEEYAVFVMNDDGLPMMQTVEVGLLDFMYAEIVSGLKAGDQVTTGIVETD
jgi:HlyD family secretion protein